MSRHRALLWFILAVLIVVGLLLPHVAHAVAVPL